MTNRKCVQQAFYTVTLLYFYKKIKFQFNVNYLLLVPFPYILANKYNVFIIDVFTVLLEKCLFALM